MPLPSYDTEKHVVSKIFFCFQGPQTIQVQGIKRMAQAAAPSSGLITKKVIIATINGTQRILTPVSSPQMIALKSAPRLLADGTLVSATSGAPITILQKSLSQQQTSSVPKPKPAAGSTQTTVQPKSMDNKTCRWKFENGQVSIITFFCRSYRYFFHNSVADPGCFIPDP
jgi:hypothetical protein